MDRSSSRHHRDRHHRSSRDRERDRDRSRSKRHRRHSDKEERGHRRRSSSSRRHRDDEDRRKSRRRSRSRSSERRRRSRSREHSRRRERSDGEEDRAGEQEQKEQRQEQEERQYSQQNSSYNEEDTKDTNTGEGETPADSSKLESLIDDIAAGEEEDEEETEGTEENDQQKLERLREERRRQRQQLLAEYGDATQDKQERALSGNSSANHSAQQGARSNASGASSIQSKPAHKENTVALEEDAHECHRKDQTIELAKGAFEQDNSEKVKSAGDSSFDMFEDDIQIRDDEDLDTTKKRTATAHMDDGVEERERIAGILGAKEEHGTLNDNWDDSEGYLKWNAGDMIGGRYRVVVGSGKGVFSSVCLCADTLAGKVVPGQKDTPEESSQYSTVAIKVLRANDTMRKAGMKELGLLEDLKKQDPHGRSCVIRYLNHFEHRNHLCIAFEPMNLNIREVLDKFGKTVGINIQAVRMYARQLLLALNALRKKEIIHADIKPHNILTNDKYNVVKLADFGSAFRESDPENCPTPLLVSRFYRSPEIILGFQHSTALDMWSLGCVLYEMYTGRVLFPGESNNEMLWLQMQLRGRLSNKMIKHHLRQAETLELTPYFDQDFRFVREVRDPVTRGIVKRKEAIPDKPQVDIRSKLLAHKSKDDSRKLVLLLQDLLDKMLTLDPNKRISVREALKHPFVGKASKKAGQTQNGGNAAQ
eukprot:gb/GECG01011834.1/.p1 GENE.gb/GECG01011834.1/~~gb/GECG01011834.1/.p1  ORF type:complete len:706 (+),score=131.77 gb/GECG01011834.1/:1-2118(+)